MFTVQLELKTLLLNEKSKLLKDMNMVSLAEYKMRINHGMKDTDKILGSCYFWRTEMRLGWVLRKRLNFHSFCFIFIKTKQKNDKYKMLPFVNSG